MAKPRGGTFFGREFGERYTGQDLEEDVFGRFRPTPEFEKEYRRLANEGGYVNFERAMELVKKHTKEDPTNPQHEFERELRLAVLEKLKVPEKDLDQVRVYTAVGTPLDKIHGVDAWLEYTDPKGRTFVVTLDVTQKEWKQEEGHKADVIIGSIVSPEDDKFLDQVDQYAAEAVKLLEQQIRWKNT